MWVESTPNGKVKYKEQYTDIYGRKRRVSVTMDKDTARNRRKAMEILAAKMKAPDVDNLTLSQLTELYLDWQRQTYKPSTWYSNQSAMRSLQRILGANTPVSSLNARMVNFRLQAQNESPGTVNGRIGHFKGLMRWAYDNDYVQDISWIDKIKKQKDDERVERLENKYLESSELKTLLDAMTVPEWKYLAELTALSGMRVGEAIALERRDVDMQTRVIHISKTYDPNNHCVNTPKTSASCRDVYMQDELLDCCRDILKYTADIEQGTHIASPLFLHDINGGHLAYHSYKDYIGSVSERVLGRRITAHYMRHTHVALLAEHGVSLDVISRRLGHGDSRITQDVYFHVTEKLREKDNQKLKDVKLI